MEKVTRAILSKETWGSPFFSGDDGCIFTLDIAKKITKGTEFILNHKGNTGYTIGDHELLVFEVKDGDYEVIE
jgi:hypothetical protein